MADRTATLTALLKDSVSGPAAKIRGEFDGLKRSASGLGSVFQGIGVGIGLGIFQSLTNAVSMLVNALPQAIEQGLSFADTVDTIQDATGASAEAASHFAGEITYLGGNAEAVAGKLGVLSSNIKAHEADLTKLGVTIRDTNGDYLDQITIVNSARSAIQAMGPGLDATKLSMELFGKAGADMLDWLNLSDKQVALLDGKLDDLGVTMSQTMVDNAQAARREQSLLNLAMQGLANTITADVAPALTVAVDSIVNFVVTNGNAIKQFASDVVSFVLGMIQSLTGMSVTTSTFTSQMAALSGGMNDAASNVGRAQSALDEYDASQKVAKTSTGGSTTAIDKQIDSLKRQQAALTAAGEAADRAYSKAMDRITASLDAQIEAIDAADRQRSVDAQRASGLRAVAEAQEAVNAAMAAGDLEGLAAAQQRLSDASAQQAEFERDQSDDTRKAQIDAVKSYVAEVMKIQQDSMNQKATLGLLEKREAALIAQQIAAQQAGDMQRVADLQAEIDALKLAESRANQAAIDADKAAAIQREIDADTARRGRISSTGKLDIDTTRAGLVAALEAAKTRQTEEETGQKLIEERYHTTQQLQIAVYGDKPDGAIGLFTAAGQAGQKFGKDIHDALVGEDGKGGALGAVQTLITAVGWLIDKLNTASLGLQYLTDPKLQQKVKDAGGIPLLSGVLDVLGGIGDWLGTGAHGPFPGIKAPDLGPLNFGMASGGSIPSNWTGWVGEKGPEILHLGSGGYITSNRDAQTLGGTPSNTVTNNLTIAEGAILVQGVTDPDAVASTILQAIKRQVDRQGMHLVAG